MSVIDSIGETEISANPDPVIIQDVLKDRDRIQATFDVVLRTQPQLCVRAMEYAPAFRQLVRKIVTDTQDGDLLPLELVNVVVNTRLQEYWTKLRIN